MTVKKKVRISVFKPVFCNKVMQFTPDFSFNTCHHSTAIIYQMDYSK